MKYYAVVGDREHVFTFERQGDRLLAHTGDRVYEIDLAMTGDGTGFSLLVDGASHDVALDATDGSSIVQIAGERVIVRVEDERERAASSVVGARAAGRRTLTAGMPGVVAEVLVAVGDTVADGQTLLILEAMKMQNPIQAEGPGRVTGLHVRKGDALANGAKLLDLDGS
jgi:biotin carboxyl carrier protein